MQLFKYIKLGVTCLLLHTYSCIRMCSSFRSKEPASTDSDQTLYTEDSNDDSSDEDAPHAKFTLNERNIVRKYFYNLPVTILSGNYLPLTNDHPDEIFLYK